MQSYYLLPSIFLNAAKFHIYGPFDVFELNEHACIFYVLLMKLLYIYIYIYIYCSGGHLYQYPVTEETIEELEPYVIREHEDGTTLEYLNIFREIIADRGLQMPESADEALTLYGTLIDAINV